MKNKKGFTLAEIIISMTIIGIIAAITIPALLVSANERAMEAQKKALAARMSQAISQIEDLRLYEKSSEGNDKSSALNFINNGLGKVYRVVRTCPISTLETHCNFPMEITTQNGDIFNISTSNKIVEYLDNSTSASEAKFGNLNTEAAAFTTLNGESILLFYNPKCHGSKTNGFYSGNAATAMCINMIYDLNGKNEAPNEVGKDIGFITVFFPKDPDIVAPITYSSNIETVSYNNYEDATEACKDQSSSLVIPSWEEGISIVLNKKLTNVSSGTYLVTGAGETTGAYNVNYDSLTAGFTSNWGEITQLRCIYNK